MEPSERSVIRYDLLDIADDCFENPNRVEEDPRSFSAKACISRPHARCRQRGTEEARQRYE